MPDAPFADPDRPWREYNRYVEDIDWDAYRLRRRKVFEKLSPEEVEAEQAEINERVNKLPEMKAAVLRALEEA